MSNTQLLMHTNPPLRSSRFLLATSRMSMDHLAPSDDGSHAAAISQSSMTIVQQFLYKNQWRLHDLFLRVVHTPDSEVPVDDIVNILSQVGGIVPLTSYSTPNLTLVTSPSLFEGTLKPLSQAQLRSCIPKLCGSTKNVVNYHAVLDQKAVSPYHHVVWSYQCHAEPSDSYAHTHSVLRSSRRLSGW